MEQIKDALEALEAKLAKQNEQGIKEVTLDLKEAKLSVKEAKEAVENAKKEAAEAKAFAETIKVKADEQDKTIQAMREAQNQLLADQKSLKLGGSSLKSYEAELEEEIAKKAETLTRFKNTGVRPGTFSIDLNRKAVGNMGSGTNLTGSYFVAPDVRPGIVLKAYEDIHMRNLLPTGRTNSNMIRHVRDLGGEGGPATVAEGGTKPQMDRDLSIVDANVRKIATYLRIPEEMIDDIPYITSFLTNMGTQEVMKFEDAQILYGDGTGQNLSGLFTNATAFAAVATTQVVTAPNRFDVLRAARVQLRRAQRSASFALVSPLDFYLMTSVKDTTNNYVLQGGGNGLLPNLDGVPIIENTQVADGDYLIMDRNAAEIDFRNTISIRFFDQDQDNAIKNMVTVVIEERLALPIYYTDGIVKGTFAAGITDLTS